MLFAVDYAKDCLDVARCDLSQAFTGGFITTGLAAGLGLQSDSPVAWMLAGLAIGIPLILTAFAAVRLATAWLRARRMHRWAAQRIYEPRMAAAAAPGRDARSERGDGRPDAGPRSHAEAAVRRGPA